MDNKINIKKSVCSKDCNGSCTILIHIQDNEILKVEGDKESPVSEGIICRKGRDYPHYLNKKNRLLKPLKRINKDKEGEFEEISWDEAYDILYNKLSDCKETYGPESVLYYQEGGEFGIMSFLYSLGFWYQYGGFTCVTGDLCNSAGSTAIEYTYGEAKQNLRKDIVNSKLIILWGKNPMHTDIHTMHYINKALKKGAKLITIDPRRNESSVNSHLHIAPECGTDGVLALGVAKLLKEKKIIKEDFINNYVYGYEEYFKYIDSITMDEIVNTTKVSLSEIEAIVSYIEESPYYSLICGSGLQRYTNGGQTIRSIAVLPPLTGSIGKSGAGLYTTDNQTNDLIWPYFPKEPQNIRDSIPNAQAASLMAHQKNPEIKLLWIEKANPLVSNPNVNKFKEEMKKIEFVVVVDLFMTDTAKNADLILPAASLFEKEDIFTSYGTPYIQMRDKVMEPIGECKSEYKIYRELAEKFGFDLAYLPSDFTEIVNEFINVNNLNTTYDRLKREPYLHDKYKEIAYEDLLFKTESGKIEFYSEKLANDWNVSPLPTYEELVEKKNNKYPLTLMSYHSSNRINSQNMKNNAKEELLHMNEKDAKERYLKSGDKVKVCNERGYIETKIIVDNSINSGIVAIAFGASEESGKSVNKLSNDLTTDFGHGTAFHGYKVEVEKINVEN